MKNPPMQQASALIVDDEKDICYLLNSILRQKDIYANLAGSIAEAQQIVHKNHPSIVFLDNHLPDGLGLEHIRELKESNPSMKIIMITAHDNPAEKEKAFREGADFFISKPFTKDIIYSTIEKLNSRGVE